MAKYLVAQRQSIQLTKNRRIPSRSHFLHFSRYNSIPGRLTEKGQPRKIDLAKCLNMQVGDLVQVLHGQDKDRQGVILRIFHKKNQAIVENCNMREVFWNPNFDGKRQSLITQEMPIHITNIAMVDPVAKKPTIVKRRYMMNGECVRICKLSGSSVPEPVKVSQSQYQKPPKRRTPTRDIYLNKDYENFNLLTKFARLIKDKRIESRLADKK
ncbi:50S ribosomal protein L24, putative [Theileria equi strain WA]|uniref:Large ribosomal subunit protein uL24c n=1 Tax=Theileria equi strain WA TaxID=1537102 RepID=L0ATK7_THEEQ|nr:50S ribosomal protein L24, putative [Theileria equi strain WA]AFZ78977.1 50S ribosomal protein L24, putative [Theileria equi strain WA]|eukprot:XP_004828643.1 50S ribosomal protein L24, putative [Theileria equi strain WA]